jgi:hypothetical protein
VLAEVHPGHRSPAGYGRGRRRRAPSRVEAEVADDSGRLSVVFFNQGWRAKQLRVGPVALFFGTIGTYRAPSSSRAPRSRCSVRPVTGPSPRRTEDERAGRVFPVYPLTERANLTSARIGASWPRPSTGPAVRRPAAVRRGAGGSAWSTGPPPSTTSTGPGRWPTRAGPPRRLAFDELFRLQLALVLRQQRIQAGMPGASATWWPPSTGRRGADPGRPVPGSGCPSALTGAQQRAGDPCATWPGPLPMHRLLQGDVGSGKTVVAVAALLVAVQGGHQGALMAPTEVLAEQHAAAVRSLVAGLAVPTPDPAGRPAAAAGCPADQHRPPPSGRDPRRPGRRRRGHPHRHPCPPDRPGRVPHPSAWWSSTSSTASASSSAPRCGPRAGDRTTEGSGSRPAGDDGHAHPADRRHGGLRRPRHDHHRRAPPGADSRSTTRWAPDALSRPRRPGRGCASEVASGHRAFVVCPLVEGSDRVEATSVVDEAERLSGGSSPACGSGSSTARCPRRRRRR